MFRRQIKHRTIIQVAVHLSQSVFSLLSSCPAGSPVVYGTPQVAPHPVYGQAPGPVLYTNGQGQYFTAVPQPPRH